MAIAKVVSASAIYSDDGDLRTFAEQQGLPVLGLADLPVPDAVREPQLPLEPPDAEHDASNAP